MFSKAKRFEVNVPGKDGSKQPENEVQKRKIKLPPPALPVGNKQGAVAAKQKPAANATPSKPTSDAQSHCSSIRSIKSTITPKPTKGLTKAPSSSKTIKLPAIPIKIMKPKTNAVQNDDIVKAQEVEIRNKDYTIEEYNKQIEELKNEIADLNDQLSAKCKHKSTVDSLNNKLSEIHLYEEVSNNNLQKDNMDIHILKQKISDMEQLCEKLEQEVSSKQVELSSLEEIIVIRDSLCQDLQNKLSNMEVSLEETKQRLEMVKGHHALALEANESIRREYKVELESLKSKFEEEKQAIIVKSKAEQDNVKTNFNNLLESIKTEILKEKDDIVSELQQQLNDKDNEMKAKLEQIDEATREKLRLCEIQFEERSRGIQEDWSKQQKQIQYLEKERNDLEYNFTVSQEENAMLRGELCNLRKEIEILNAEKLKIVRESEDLKEESKRKYIDFENEINKLTVEIDKTLKEKSKFELSLSVTRDIVNVLSTRLRESDNELEHLEKEVIILTDSKNTLEHELATYKTTLSNTVQECDEYKEALVNILKSKTALTKEHSRIMEHNSSLIESLQNVEKEAYRELGSIKHDLIEDVELLKKESKSQIQMLRDEVEKKRVLCEMATEHAGQATAAAEQSRQLLAQAAAEITRLETENHRFQQQIQDQQSLVVELSLLRQENEELTMTLAKQSSLVDKAKKDAEQMLAKPKSPSVLRKAHKTGKENLQLVISPLRERNY